METLQLKTNSKRSASGVGSWSKAVIFGLPVAGLILGMFGYWFGFADRYVVFLYYHDMGPRVPDTSPFSRVTASRYWMAGLVAAGAVMLMYAAANWLLGRLSKRYQAPLWWQVWLVAALPLFLGIPAITISVNEPVLPWTLAIIVMLVTLAGLALALLPGEVAARKPARFFWLAADGWGLALLLLSLPHMEDFGFWLTTGSGWQLALSLLLTLVGLVWLLLLSFLHARLRIPVDGTATLFLAGCCVAYLLLPFVHHTMATDGYFYLTNSDNFFARGLGAQLPAWMVTALVAWGMMRLRLALGRR